MKKALAISVALGALLAGVLAATPAIGQDKPAAAAAAAAAPAKPADEAAIASQLPSYPLTTCAVCDQKLEKPVDRLYKGRLVRMCCADCFAALEKDPAKPLAKIDAAVIEQQGKRYPLATCPVSGKPVGADAYAFVVGTKMVRTCCDKCPASVEKDSAAALAKVDAAWLEAGKKDYPLDTCPVSGEKLGSMGAPVDHLYGTRLVRLCCKSCTKELNKEPAAVLAKIDAAAAAKKPAAK